VVQSEPACAKKVCNQSEDEMQNCADDHGEQLKNRCEDSCNQAAYGGEEGRENGTDEIPHGS